jgi:hypothetical protein
MYIAISAENATSLSNENITELSNIFDAIGFPISFNTLAREFESRITTEKVHDLESAIGITPDEFNWSEAMTIELEWLKNNRVVTGLTDQDIEDIAILAKDTVAEHNLKGRYYNDSWIQGVTDEMLENEVTQIFPGELNCDGFSLETLPSFTLQDFNTGFRPLDIIFESSIQGQTIRMGLIGIGILFVGVFVLRWKRRLRKRKRR